MRYLTRRVAFLIGTLWVALTFNFLIPRMMPGSPAETMIANFHGKGQINPNALHAIQIMLGISTAPLWKQYLQYWGQVLQFKFGISYTYFPYTVTHMIAQALPYTLILVGACTVISFVLGTSLGIAAAWWRGGRFDATATTALNFSSAFPYFWFALFAAYWVSFRFHWLPLSGAFSSSISPMFNWTFVSSALRHAILPALTIVISSMGGWLLGMRNNMISTLREDYIVLAEAKGLRASWIAFRYAARNAILPNITGFAMALGFVVSGSLVMETVFAYPGIGYLLVNAVGNEDYPLMQGVFLIIVLAVVMANFVVDLLYVFIDPRVSNEGRV